MVLPRAAVRSFRSVMAGLGPATQVLLGRPKKDVGGRAKPGHDTGTCSGHDTVARSSHATVACSGHDTGFHWPLSDRRP